MAGIGLPSPLGGSAARDRARQPRLGAVRPSARAAVDAELHAIRRPDPHGVERAHRRGTSGDPALASTCLQTDMKTPRWVVGRPAPSALSTVIRTNEAAGPSLGAVCDAATMSRAGALKAWQDIIPALNSSFCSNCVPAREAEEAGPNLACYKFVSASSSLLVESHSQKVAPALHFNGGGRHTFGGKREPSSVSMPPWRRRRLTIERRAERIRDL